MVRERAEGEEHMDTMIGPVPSCTHSFACRVSCVCYVVHLSIPRAHYIASRRTDCVDGRILKRGRRVSVTLRKVRGCSCECSWPSVCDTQNPSSLELPTRLPAHKTQTDGVTDGGRG